MFTLKNLAREGLKCMLTGIYYEDFLVMSYTAETIYRDQEILTKTHKLPDFPCLVLTNHAYFTSHEWPLHVNDHSEIWAFQWGFHSYELFGTEK